MSTVTDAIVKGAVGGAGFLASAYTLTKFIVATPVKIAPRGDAEHDLDVVLCFDTKKFSQEAVDFFVQMVQKQSHLTIVPKVKNVLEEHEEAEDKKEGTRPEETFYLLGAAHATLVAIKQKKERALHGDVSEAPVPERFCSGDRIDLLLFELGRLKYSDLASSLTQYENHRTDSDFANARVLKLALFYFVNNFGFLFYVAFKTRDMVLLEQTLSSLLITRQLLGNMQEQLMPYMSQRSSLKAEAGKLAKEAKTTDAIVSKVDAELLFPTYDGTFDDYLEMFVQFGQVTLFASAYPLASLWSLCNNIMEIRSDGFKLCVSFRRSHRTSTHGIGTWYYAFSALGYLSVVTNCAIFGLHSGFLNRLFPKMSFAGSLVAIALMEHAMIAVKVCVEMFVPDTTAAVVEAHRMKRAWLRKKASLQVELSSRQLLQQQPSEDGDSTQQQSPPRSQEAVAAEDVNEWLSREKERRLKLERELKSLNDLYMGWIREEQTKRKKTEHKLAALMERVKAPLHAAAKDG
ncbi:anoctamin-like protein [Phytophthora cinnamomi]|uniref:anoctamin-like protein n=1 Tax=Phytophthora cinnamomi TaxID=4785 RepID=UPI00355AA839|nr:anoctamin-like protein [Phytophthora cinnamomi]